MLTVHHTGRWTLGVLIGLPIAVLFIVISLAGFAFCVYWMIVGDPDNGYVGGWSTRRMFRTWGAIPLIVALIIALCVGAGFWPWQAAYHQYREVDGTVTQISNRFVGDGNSTSQKYVVTLQGSPQQFGITDTRAALLKPGDHVTLSCIRVYTYGAQYGYDCNWGKP